MGVAVSVIVLFIVISLGLVLTINFYTSTGQTPPLSGIWALAIAGMGILAVILYFAKMA